jgi:hypothetical protein
MMVLENSELCVSILHPLDDQDRLGVRFCSGGYVYQVDDKKKGPLFSGPEYPSAAPSVINGQGMPDVFQFTQYENPDECPPAKMIIGVGVLNNVPPQKASDIHFSLPVSERCQWEVAAEADAVTMTTTQSYAGRSLELARVLRLRERTLTSTTRLKNSGTGAMMFRWFAHPFFPRISGGESCMPGFTYALPQNAGFYVDGDGAVGLHETFDWNVGWYQLLEGVEGQLFSVRQRHPLCGEVRVDGDFPMHRVALWANRNTFSIEPFLQRTLHAGEEYEWTLSYRF